jgi:hypothetical protein
VRSSTCRPPVSIDSSVVSTASPYPVAASAASAPAMVSSVT